MKQIKNMKQLQEQKREFSTNTLQAEENIRRRWSSLKESLKPGNLAEEAIDTITQNTTTDKLSESNVLKNTFTYGLTLLAQKFADKTAEKIKKLFKK